MYTPDLIMEKLSSMLEEAKTKESLYIGSALASACIDRDMWQSWRTAYASHPIISERMRIIELTYESRLVESALSGKSNATVSVLALKSIYGWSDKKDSEPKTAEAPYQAPTILVREGYVIEI